MRVLKFGGSTLRTPESCREVIQVIRRARRRGETIVVVSALHGVTNRLVALVHEAEHHHLGACRRMLREIRDQHEDAIRTLIAAPQRPAVRRALEERCAELQELCDGISHVHECSPRTRDRLIGYGELLSAALVAAALTSARCAAGAVDARTLIVTDANFGEARVDLATTRDRLRRARRGWRGRIPVITGFIAATAEGVPTTVGRNGSDYTAALVGALLGAEEIEIWTDVDGVLSADPSEVRDAFTLPHLSYSEAMELAYFGAKVLHPHTVIPAIDAKIPLRILNIFNADAPGTLISAKPTPSPTVVKGITSIPAMSLISVEGAGMVGVTGVAARMFKALAQAGINVTIISQGSSEQSICCVVRCEQGAVARRVLREAFAAEFRRHQIRRIVSRDAIAVIAVVGAAMQGTPGIAARLFGALAKNKINVVAVAQGSSEQNISLVIDAADRTKALNVIHGVFHLSRRQVHVVIVGKGTIGSRLLTQIAEGQERLERDLDLRLRVVGIADRRRFLFHADGIPLAHWDKALATCRERMGIGQLTARLQASRLENLILVDATADEAIAKEYPHWLAAGISIVTPNKKANTLPLPLYDQLQRVVRRRHSYYLHETSVGAGLPVISTLQDLINSGDAILQIEAMLSGTLGYIFSELETGRSFSAAVRGAFELGYTEPDPRDDLSGMDVARKLLILARKAGARLSLPQVRVAPILPPSLRKGGDVPSFFRRLPGVDADYHRRVEAVAKEGKVLRFIGQFRDGRCGVALRAVDRDSPFGRLRGGDNMVVFTTARYRTNPLIVQGPGAGPDVTAGGVFADILKVAHLLTTN